MRIVIGQSVPHGTVQIPASKSIAHRYLIAAAFSAGHTVIHGLPDNADIRATLDCLRKMGARILLCGETAKVDGIRIGDIPDGIAVDCHESGTTLRLLLPFAMVSGKRITFKGAERLFARPLSVYEDICRAQEMLWQKRADSVTVGGMLHADTFRFPGNISSQFVSGLLLALPHLGAESTVLLTSAVESASYIGLTLAALNRFGYRVKADGIQSYRIPGGQTGCGAGDLTVPTDQSAAAFFGAMQTLGGEVRLAHFCDDGMQGDRVWKSYIEQLCAENCVLSVADCPDLAPVLMVVAALHHGCTLLDTARLRFKESDRGAVMAQELEKCGVRVVVGENSIDVSGGALHAPAVPICAHNDHRIAMSLAVLLCRTGGVIDGAECVAKSMPEFWQMLRALEVDLHTERDSEA